MFALVVKLIAFYMLFVIAAFYDLDINQMNVKTTFLYKKINQLLSVKMAKGYYNDIKSIFCKLNKALHSFKQSPQIWYK